MKSTPLKFLKISLIFFLPILCSSPTFGQEIWTISRIKGKVFCGSKPLSVGDKVKSDEDFNFDKPNSYVQVRLNNPLRIRLIIEKCYRESNAKTLKDYFTYTDDLASRSEEKKSLSSFSYLNNNMSILVVDTLKLRTNNTDIKFSTTHFIYASYDHKGNEINKILKHQDGDLFFDSSIFTTKKHGVISSQNYSVNLVEYKKSTNYNSLKFSNIKFLFITGKEVKANFFQYFEDVHIPKNLKKEFVMEFIRFRYPGFGVNLDDIITSIFSDD